MAKKIPKDASQNIAFAERDLEFPIRRKAIGGVAVKNGSLVEKLDRNGTRCIVKTRGICGGRARVEGTRIPVWGIENARRSGYDAAAIAKMYAGLTSRDIHAAFSYALAHRNEIDSAIQDNEDA